MKTFNLIIFSFLAIVFVSCSTELHRSGQMSENYIAAGGDLYVTYKNDGKRFLLAMKLDPLVTKWEKRIANLSDEAVFRLYGDHIVSNCKAGEICFLSRDTGNNAFSFSSPVVMKKGYKGLTVSGSQVFGICATDEICSYDIDTEKKLWSKKIDDYRNIVFDFMVEDGRLFFGTETKIFALSTETGKDLWETDELNDLKTYAPVGDTILVNYEVIDGLDTSDGKSKWLTPYTGERIRCVMDGVLIAQSDTQFNILFAGNGSEISNYPRVGTTLLNCQEQLSLAAFTVKKSPDTQETAEYFDRIDILDAGSGVRVFDYRAEAGRTIMNIAAMFYEHFYIVVADDETEREARVERFSYADWEKDVSYDIPDPEAGKNIYITLTHIDSRHTIFRSAIMDLSENTPASNHLYVTETGELLGELSKHPDIITATSAYDIVIYDTYFNIIEKKITDFLK
jgi:hypothetical protein